MEREIKEIEPSVNGTIVSLFPYDIGPEFKPGLIPSYFTIVSGDPVKKELGITHIKMVQRRIDHPAERGGVQRLPVLASDLCESLISDYTRASIEIAEDAKPALFWIPGILNIEEINSKHTDKVDLAMELQKNWFIRLVQEADNAWNLAKSHRSVTTIQKYAARFLKLDRDWLTELEIEKSLSVCPLCTAKVSPAAIVCPNCKAVLKQKEYDEYMKRKVG